MKGLMHTFAVLTLALGSPAAAQTALLEIDTPGDATLMQVNDDAGLVVHGVLANGGVPASGSGVRMVWYPGKAAFRAGSVSLSQWDDENIGRWSAALGENATASGDGSMAFGAGTVASQLASVALGYLTQATGEIATAIGRETVASGSSATALGFATIASGSASIAMGDQSQASGGVGTAMGQRTVASGFAATAMGGSTTASGPASLATGRNTLASGNVATAMGAETMATGQFATALGQRAEARGEGSFAFGDASTTGMVVAVAPNTFIARAAGGFSFLTSANLTTGCDIGNGNLVCTGTVSGSSSAALKHDFEPVSADSILDKVAGLRIQRWRYLADTADVRHIGPTAEDFRDAFGLGADERTIAMVDADGVAMLAVQALARRTDELRREVEVLRARLSTLAPDVRDQDVQHPARKSCD